MNGSSLFSCNKKIPNILVTGRTTNSNSDLEVEIRDLTNSVTIASGSTNSTTMTSFLCPINNILNLAAANLAPYYRSTNGDSVEIISLTYNYF